MSEDKKIIIDEDWKSQVEREKEEAAQQPTGEPEASASGLGDGAEQGAEQGADAPRSPDDPVMPPASIGMLMSSLATEAMISLGAIPHPATGETTVRRNQAKYLIDTLDVLKQKTAGNLTADEAAALEDVLHQLRMAFVAQPPGGGA